MPSTFRLSILFLLAAGPIGAADPTGTTDLHRAAERGDAVKVDRLLKEGADPNAANRYGVRPLSLACEANDAEAVLSLLRAGADPNSALASGETPLMTSARVGSVEMAEVLLAAGAKVDATERAGQSALMWAADAGHADLAALLADAGADLRLKLKSGFTPLLFAARSGRVEVIRELLARGIDPDEASDTHRPGGFSMPPWTTALRIAVENGHFETAVALLEAGADPNDQRSGHAPLHVLSWVRKPHRGDGPDGLPPPRIDGELTTLRFAERLVREFGADVDLALVSGRSGGKRLGTKGATPFLLAAARADLDYLQVLLSLGANPAIPNSDGTTALLAACGVGSHAPEEEAGTEPEALETLRWLRDQGASVAEIDRFGETAMHGAAYRNWPEVVAWIVGEGLPVETWNRKNKHGWTPLLIAQGFRPGNFKPSAATIEAIKSEMRAAGVEIPPDPPLPSTERPKKYEP